MADRPAWASADPASSAAPEWARAAPTPVSAPAQAAKPPGAMDDLTHHTLNSIGEAGLNMATGAIAKPVSEVAGLAALAEEIMSPRGRDPSGIQRDVQEKMTYQPRTAGGQAVAKYNPMAMAGRGVDWLGGKAQGMIEPPPGARDVSPLRVGLASGVHEAVNQAPGLLGVGKGKEMGEATGDAMKSAGRSTMASALKPPLEEGRKGNSVVAPRYGKEGAIDTLLGDPKMTLVSEGGLKSMHERINALNDKVDSLVGSSKLSINKTKVAGNLKGTISEFEKQVNATDDIVALQKVRDDFMNHPLLFERETIPVQLAQDMKTGTYRQLKKKYGQLGSADIEGQKALAAGIKKELDRAIPEARPLNAEESRLLNALPLLERRVLMSANRNPVGLGMLTTKPEAFVGWMADRSDLFKSLVARMLYKGGGAMKEAGPPAIGAMGAGASQYAGQMPAPPAGQPPQ